MLGVLSLHSNIGKTDNLVGFVLQTIASISIPLFFMVNGYLMIGRDIDYSYVSKKSGKILKFILTVGILYWVINYIIGRTDWADLLPTVLGSLIQQGQFFVFWYFGSIIIIYLALPLLNRWINNSQITKIAVCLLGGGILINTIFVLNVQYNFESNIIQTFRLWNWLFYFILGGLLKSSSNVFYRVKLWHIFIAALLLLLIVYSTKNKLDSVEYYFGSLQCIVLTLLVFLFFMQHSFKKGLALSNLFLPVYTLHMLFVRIPSHLCIDTIKIFGFLYPLADYIIFSVFTITFCFFLMKIPFMKKVFSI